MDKMIKLSLIKWRKNLILENRGASSGGGRCGQEAANNHLRRKWLFQS